MAKMTRRKAPPKAIAPTPVATEEQPVDSQQTVPAPEAEPEPEVKEYSKNPLPPHKFSMICGECNTECSVHTKKPDEYTAEMIAELFVERGGSYDPPLCGFCKRKKDRLAGKKNTFFEPKGHQTEIQPAA